MNQFYKAKFIIFFSLLGGGIFLIIALITFPRYQSNFSAVILEKELSFSDSKAKQSQEKITYALSFAKHFLLSDTFIEQVEKRIDTDIDNLSAQGEFSIIKETKDSSKKKWKINRKNWRQSISTKNNATASLIFIKFSSNNPKLTYLYSLEAAQIFKETLPEFINTEELEIKILNGPTKATPNSPDFIYFSILGFIAGGLTGTTFLMFFKEKITTWSQKITNLRQKEKKDRKKEKETEVEFIAYPRKNTTIKKEAKEDQGNETLSDEKIKERLNRLINGEF